MTQHQNAFQNFLIYMLYAGLTKLAHTYKETAEAKRGHQISWNYSDRFGVSLYVDSSNEP